MRLSRLCFPTLAVRVVDNEALITHVPPGLCRHLSTGVVTFAWLGRHHNSWPLTKAEFCVPEAAHLIATRARVCHRKTGQFFLVPQDYGVIKS